MTTELEIIYDELWKHSSNFCGNTKINKSYEIKENLDKQNIGYNIDNFLCRNYNAHDLIVNDCAVFFSAQTKKGAKLCLGIIFI